MKLLVPASSVHVIVHDFATDGTGADAYTRARLFPDPMQQAQPRVLMKFVTITSRHGNLRMTLRAAMTGLAAILLASLMAGCAMLPDGGEPRNFILLHGIDSTRPDQFAYCHGASCRNLNKVALTASEWAHIRDVFSPAAASAREERQQIATAVARYETAVGRKTGTDADKGGNIEDMMTFVLDSSQIDCVSETINTTTLMLMLDDAGLLRWHTPWRPANRFSVTGWFHSTAVIREKATGADYAIDSWFFDNGQPAAIVALKDWQDGWVPQ